MKIFRFVIALTLFSIAATERSAAAETSYASQKNTVVRSPGFETPSVLRDRVNFWKDIFAKYGKYQLVVHHRRYPQIIFKVLDFSKAAQNLSAVQLDVLRKKIERQKTDEIEGYLKNLARTGAPSNSMEEYIVRQMDFLPGGTKKYQDAIDNEWVRTQTGIKERYQEAIRRTGRYLPAIERIFVREYNLPVELTRLPFVESSFDYTAYSSVGAAGIWQFMRTTARKMMSVNNYVDERLDPFIATRAAARYLQQAYRSLGSWPEAVTSYNHGVAGVYRKMKEAGSSDLPSVIERTYGDPVFGFASSNFFPEFLAAVEIYDDYLKHFPGLTLLPELRVREYPIPRPVYLQQVARTLGVDKDELLEANYALLSPIATGRRPIPAGYVLRIPVESSSAMARLDTIPASAPEPVHAQAASSVYGGNTYAVRKGDTLLAIAKKYQMTVNELKALNNLGNSTLKVGRKLAVRSEANLPPQPVILSKAEGTQSTKKQGGEREASKKTHTVRQGDSLWSIGKRYGVSADRIKAANKLKDNHLKLGRKLVIP